jgi:hypothetical protein
MKVFLTTSLVLICLLGGAIHSIGQGIQVESAFYGSRDGVGVDVTSRVQRFADYGEPFRVGSETLRIDPSPNRPKTLTVVYYINGRRISETVPEGEVFYFRSGKSSSGAKGTTHLVLLSLRESLFPLTALDDKRIIVTVQSPRTGRNFFKIYKTPICCIGVP